MGSGSYALRSQLNNKDAVGIGIFQSPGANAIDLSNAVRAKMAELATRFPEDMQWAAPYDPTVFVRDSIRAVVQTLLEAVVLATCFFGLTGSLFFADSESPILMITFFSVGLIFLSGMSYPLELMPWYWQAAHFVIPASPGVLAFIKLNSMGAGMADIEREYVTLWIQCIVYFISACLAFRYNIRKAIRNRPAGARAASRNDVPTPAPAKGIAEPASVENTVE